MRQLARNVLSTYVARGASIVALLFLFPFIAGQVGLEKYGIWLLVSSFAWLFMSDLGIGTSAARYVAEAVARDDADLGSRTLSTGLACFVAVGGVAALLFWGAVAVAWPSLGIPDADRDLAGVIVALAGVGYLLLALPLSLFRHALAGLQRYDVANGVVVAQAAVRVSLTVGVLLAGGGILAVVLIDLGAAVGGGLLMLAATRRLAPHLVLARSKIDAALARSVAPYSLQVFVLGIGALVVLQADNFIIGLFLPVAAVSLYAGAFRAYQLCREVTASLMIPLVPDAAHAGAQGDEARLRGLLLDGTRIANGLLALVAVPVALLAGPLLVLWAGPEFGEAGPVAQILIAGLLVNNVHLVALPLMVGLGEVRRYAWLHGAWALGNVGLSVALIGPLELRGVALGTVIPLVLLEPFYIQAALRRLGVETVEFCRHALLRGYGPAVPPALLLVVAVVVVDPQGAAELAAAVTAWVGVYGLLFWRLCLRAEERTALGRFARRRRVRKAGLAEKSARKTP